MSVNVASDAAMAAVEGAGDDIFSGIDLPGEAPASNQTPAPASDDFSVQAFAENPEPDFVGARMAQDDPTLPQVQPQTPPAGDPRSSQVVHNQTPQAPEQQIQMLSGMVQQLMDQNKMLMERGVPGHTNVHPSQQTPQKSQAEILQEQVEALIKKEFPEDDGTVGKFAKLMMGQFQAVREADQQALEGRINASRQAQLESQISSEANEVASSIVGQGYTFKNPEAQEKFSHLVRDLSLVLTSLNGGTPKQYLQDIQNVFNEGVYARASFLGNRSKATAANHTPAPRQLTGQAPPIDNRAQAGQNMNAPISNWEIRQAGYATNAEAIFDDFKKVLEMRRRG